LQGVPRPLRCCRLLRQPQSTLRVSKHTWGLSPDVLCCGAC